MQRIIDRVSPTLLEWSAALCLAAGLAWGGERAWRFYEASLRPAPIPAEALPPARPRAVRADDSAEIKRWQEVLDKLGAAGSARAAKQYEWAKGHLWEVLALDPGNEEALEMLRVIELEPQPTPTPMPTATAGQ